jgi:hypothetical protein
MSNYTHTQKKSRGSRDQNSRAVVVETPQRETTGISITPFLIEDAPDQEIFDNAQGEKKVSSFEENEKDFSQKRTALLDKQKQLDTPKEKAHLKRLSIVSVFEQRGYFRQSDLLNECQTRMIYYECTECGSIGWSLNHCGMRVCPDCAGRMKMKLLAKYEKGISRLKDFYKSRLKLVTLTLKNVSDLRGPDFNAISQIKEAFYRLRKRRVLKRKIYGGVYGVEATNNGKGWHVHIHALISSEFIKDACREMKQAKNLKEEKKLEREKCAYCKKECLRRFWQEETGSSVIDVRKANTEGIIEVIGYIAKPLSTENAELLVDWWEIMRNRPFLKSFGCFYDMRKLKASLTCPWCGGQKFKVYYGSRVRLFDMRDELGRSPPLGVDIKHFQRILFIEPSKVVVTTDDRGFEDTVLYLQSNLELLVGTYK